MPGEAARLMQECASEARADEAARSLVAGLLREFDQAPGDRKRTMYEFALFTALGALYRAAANDPDVLEELRGRRDETP